MDWFSVPPSAPIQWVSFIASIIALVGAIMALPTVLQMIWGRPKIMIDFDVYEPPDTRFLQCEILNSPITKGILKALYIQRMPAEEIVANFDIKESGTQRIVFPATTPTIKTDAGVTATRIRLPASIFPAMFAIVAVSKTDGKVKPCVKNTKLILAPGLYCAHVNVVVGGKAISKQRNFMVTEDYPFTFWY